MPALDEQRASAVRSQPRALPSQSDRKDAGDAFASTFYAELNNADDWLGTRAARCRARQL
jgi:hypothetical protein